VTQRQQVSVTSRPLLLLLLALVTAAVADRLPQPVADVRRR